LDTDVLRSILEDLGARPLDVAGSESGGRRLSKAAARFIRREIDALKAYGVPVKRAVTVAYHRARAKGLIP